jgi:hypothetical protein
LFPGGVANRPSDVRSARFRLHAMPGLIGLFCCRACVVVCPLPVFVRCDLFVRHMLNQHRPSRGACVTNSFRKYQRLAHLSQAKVVLVANAFWARL